MTIFESKSYSKFSYKDNASKPEKFTVYKKKSKIYPQKKAAKLTTFYLKFYSFFNVLHLQDQAR